MFIFQMPSKVMAGDSCLNRLEEEVQKLEAEKVLIVTDRNLEKAGLVKKVTDNLGQTELILFNECSPDPSTELIQRGTEVIRKRGVDLLIAIGGGSNIDAAKGMSIMAANKGPLTQYEGPEKFPNEPLPIISVPTTAGTGSEITFFAVITDLERDYKFLIWSPRIAPKVAFLDPSMVATAPRTVKIPAGMDALAHAVESYLSKMASPLTEICALKAINLVFRNLRGVLEDKPDLDCLKNMQYAATIAAMSFANAKLGIVHAMALSLSAMYHVPHGVAISILLPHGLEFNRPARPDKFIQLAQAMKIETQGLSAKEVGKSVVEAVKKLSRDTGAPHRMREVGVKKKSFEKMVQDSMKSGHVQVNPRKIEAQDIFNIYQAAY